jgi:hypothetical protein
MANPQHHHPGQEEPRAHGEIHYENRTVELNSASKDELAVLPSVPRSSWKHVRSRAGRTSSVYPALAKEWSAISRAVARSSEERKFCPRIRGLKER